MTGSIGVFESTKRSYYVDSGHKLINVYSLLKIVIYLSNDIVSLRALLRITIRESFLSELKIVKHLAITALAEIIGCYLTYLWPREGKLIWPLVPSTLSLVAEFTPNRC